LDEAHRLEEEVVKFTGISISKRRWKRYIPDFEIVNYGYNDMEKWIEFLIELQTKMLAEDISEELAVEAKRDTEKLTQAITIHPLFLNEPKIIIQQKKMKLPLLSQ
jgi:Rad3-related DNA helicase